MLTRETVVDQIEIDGTGQVRLRLGLLIVDGGVEIARKYHRTAFNMEIQMDGLDVVGAQIDAVNAHLLQMGEQPVSPQDVDAVRAHFDLSKARLAAAKA